MNYDNKTRHLAYFRRGYGLLALAALVFAINARIASANTDAQEDIVSSGTGTTILDGIYINDLVGANRFYGAGYNGSRAVQANIEAQFIWDGHEALLNHVQEFVQGTGAIGGVGEHPTMVGQAMGGQVSGHYQDGNFERGIADGARLWSGAIATEVNGGNFSITEASAASVYAPILKTGVNGQTADVFNSSWGFSDSTGHNPYAMGVDGLLYQTGKVGVASAGNSGPDPNSVGGIAAGYNSIAVGALGNDTDPVPYNQASFFSSRGLNDYYDPNTQSVVQGARARVDIAAPGESLTVATLTPAGETGNDRYQAFAAGTSFAAPIVGGGASLVVDAGKDMYAANAQAIDGRVVKAVLLNGAAKTEGWDNG